ncbi:unnamed protein product [Mytilus coruscus]|uniref:Uncharacterized protein n=1 Tax=Mytilus coruscus TaxID=42192 RepID=A0A6J8C3U8_MYTCO|nr:unnamed protein product [Mytilus coruscus]
MTCVTSVNIFDIGARTAHLTGSRHFSTTLKDKAPNDLKPVFNDKYIDCESYFSKWGNANSINEYSIFLEQIKFFENAEHNSTFHGVKGSLNKHIEFWKNIGASDFVINTIKGGYIIPFLETPKQMHCKNNKSEFMNEKFVDEAISELLDSGCAKLVPFKPFEKKFYKDSFISGRWFWHGSYF